MKRKTYAQLRRQEQTYGYLLIGLIVLIFLAVGWLEWEEREDRFNHCMFLYGPQDAAQERAAVAKCSRKAGYLPVDYEPYYED